MLIRIRIPKFSKTNKKNRVKNIVSYFFGAIGATFKVGKMDYVFSIFQPPILDGLLGVWGKWMKHAKYIYNIQEFNSEQVLAVGYTKSKFVIMYSSNIGLYYKFEKLIGVVERFKPGTKTSEGREVVFVFVGASSVLDKLMLYVK